MFYLKRSYIGLTWVFLGFLKGNTHVDHNQLDPLPFKIIYTNIVDLDLWFTDNVS